MALLFLLHKADSSAGAFISPCSYGLDISDVAFMLTVSVDDRFPPDATVEFIFSNWPEKMKGEYQHLSVRKGLMPFMHLIFFLHSHMLLIEMSAF